ncbi:hypothetical protein [Estrella lausannensis]|uniref:Uncharacterized protein n=1 Tax=Estrella lausannensis TaxID=483423 RepID=A0A0H5DNV4_9BACT|nr:hypothetical protein [Estrella lausannensis]CRX38076.1 hypothetical protein ELAC_0724 [Estrella lausannensis]
MQPSAFTKDGKPMEEFPALSQDTHGQGSIRRRRGNNSSLEQSPKKEERSKKVSNAQKEVVERQSVTTDPPEIKSRVKQEAPQGGINIYMLLKNILPETLSCLGSTDEESSFSMEEGMLRRKLLEELSRSKDVEMKSAESGNGDSSEEVTRLKSLIERKDSINSRLREKIARLEEASKEGGVKATEPSLSEAKDLVREIDLLTAKLHPETTHPELVTPHDVRQTILQLSKQVESLKQTLEIEPRFFCDLTCSMLKKQQHRELTDKIRFLQEKLGVLLSDLTTAVDSQPKIDGSDLGKAKLAKHYTPTYQGLESICNEYLAMKDLFDIYIAELQRKIITDEQMVFQIPAAHLTTISYVMEAFTAIDMQKKLESADERYSKRYERLRELLLKRVNIEENLNHVAHTIYSKLMGIGAGEFISKMESSLVLIRNNVSNPRAIQVKSLQDWFLIKTLTKEIKAIQSFIAMAADSRRVIREMASSSAALGEEQVLMHYNTLKSEYKELKRRADQLLGLMQNVQAALKKQVEEWETDPRITDYNLQRQAIVRGTTESVIKEQEYTPFLEAHRERKQLLAQITSELKTFNESFVAARKEANRLYDSIQRSGVHISETRFNVQGYTDPELELPAAQMPSKAEEEKQIGLSSSQIASSSMSHSTASDEEKKTPSLSPQEEGSPSTVVEGQSALSGSSGGDGKASKEEDDGKGGSLETT